MKITIDFEDGNIRTYTTPLDINNDINQPGTGIEIKTCHPKAGEIMQVRLVDVHSLLVGL